MRAMDDERSLILEICGEKCSNTLGSCKGSTVAILMSIIADLGRSRYASPQSTSKKDRNRREVQRDGLDVRVKRQC